METDCTMRNACVLSAALLVLMASSAGCSSKGKARPLAVYCAAGLRDPISQLIPVFERDHAPATVRVDYAGSGELLGRMRAASAPEHRPDVFIAAEESYAQQARQVGLVDRCETLAYFVPVIAVAKGNPKGIRALANLGRTDVKVVLGDPRGPAIGLVTDQILAKAGLMSVRQRVGGAFATAQAVATQVSLHNADACIIWDTVARQGDFRDALEVVPIPDAPLVRIVIGRVTQCSHPEVADDFIRLVTTTETARAAFRRYGFNVPVATIAASSPTSTGSPGGSP